MRSFLTDARTSWRYGAPNARAYCRRNASALPIGRASLDGYRSPPTPARMDDALPVARDELTSTEPWAPSRTFWTSDGSRTAGAGTSPAAACWTAGTTVRPAPTTARPTTYLSDFTDAPSRGGGGDRSRAGSGGHLKVSHPPGPATHRKNSRPSPLKADGTRVARRHGRVVRVTGVTVAYVWCHGDPYVFPAGFAEQEHVQGRSVQFVWTDHPRSFRHPDAGYDHQEEAILEQARAHTHPQAGAARGPEWAGPGPPGVRRARPRRDGRVAGDRPRAGLA